jgi:methionine-gamma-lyase
MDSMRSASVMKTYVHFILESSSTVIMLRYQNILKRRNKTVYPGLKSHPSHDLYAGMINSEYGFGGMTLDVGSLAKANALMELMQSRTT